MRTKQVEISKEEQEFQKKLDTVVRGYEERIGHLVKVRDSLRKIRKCQYCGGKYYANGLCVNCYNVMRRVNGDIEEFKKKRTRYGYRVNKTDDWKKHLWESVFPDETFVPNQEILDGWINNLISKLKDEDILIVKYIYEDGWSLRGCANLMGKERGWVLSRVNSIKNTAKKIEIQKNNKETKEEDSNK